MPIKICKNCLQPYTVDNFVTDFVHECHSGVLARDQEDVVVVGDWSDYSSEETITIIESCDSITGFTTSGGTTPTTDTTNYKEGTASINTGKSQTGTNIAQYYKTITSFNGINKFIYLWVYITNLSEIKEFNGILLLIGNNSANYTYKYFSRSQLQIGWNLIGYDIKNGTTFGNFDISAIDYFEFRIVTTNASDTITHGNIKIDKLHTINYIATKIPLQHNMTAGRQNKQDGTYAQMIDPTIDTETVTNRGARASTHRQRQKLQYNENI